VKVTLSQRGVGTAGDPLRVLGHVALLALAGVDPSEIARRAGHSSVAFTYDCENPPRSSVTLLGCGSVIASVTQPMTGFVPFSGLVRSWSPAPAR
jgi:hypothetical protein